MVKPIELKGIIRSTSPQNNADGNCEEIINMRLDSGSWRTVGKKAMILDNVDYAQVYAHKYGAFENFIGVKGGEAVWFAARKDGKVVSKNQVVCPVSGKVAFSHLNNILLVRDDNDITKAVFTEGVYGVTILELPDIPDLSIKLEGQQPPDNDFTRLDVYTDKPDKMKEAKELIRGLMNKEKAVDPAYTEGYVFICTTYQLFDGSETKPSPPIVVEVGEYLPGLVGSEQMPERYPNHIAADIRIKDMKLQKLQLRVENGVDEKYKDMITKINVYISPAYSFYDMDEIYPEKIAQEDFAAYYPVVKQKKLKDRDVEKILLYKAFDVEAVNPATELRTIKFDDNLTTGNTMPVDASGWINKRGDMFVYNNRLHLYNIRQSFIESPELGNSWLARPSYELAYEKRKMVAFVYLKIAGETLVLRYDCVCSLENAFTLKFPKVITFPDSRAYRIVFYDRYNSCTPFSVNLLPSATYNFAFRTLEETSVNVPVDDSKPAKFPAEVNGADDNMNLVVSEAMNPYYFPVEHSYLMPGEIINLSVNTEQISTSQVGQYPLYVFTTEGIYALQVGDGKVLYSHVIPISAEVAVKGSDVLQTKYGIVFVTKKGLKLIAGSSVTDFSEPVNGHVETQLRESEKFVLINSHQKTFNARPYLSTVSFAEYIRAAEMGYDITEDEIIISNPSYKYSYVFSLKTKTWHKITETFQSINRNLGLQAYTQVTTAATATLRVKSTVAPDGIERYSKVIAFPEMTLPLGTVTVYIEYAGLSLPVLTHDVPPEGVPLLELIKKIELPKPLGVFVERENKIYSSILTGIRVRMDEPEDLYFPSVAGVYDVPYEAVGVGERFSITLAGREYSKVTEKTDTTESIVKLIADWVREQGFSVETKNDTLTITALTPGVEGNKIKFTSTPSAHVELNVTGFSGGAESTPKLRVCDIQEETDGVVLAYFQTRPVSLDFFGFKKLTHAAVRGEFKPGGDNQCYFFVFGSNDFTDWSIVMEGSTFKERPNVCMSRAARSYRYFIFFSGGEVLTRKHVFAFAEIEGETVLDERLR